MSAGVPAIQAATPDLCRVLVAIEGLMWRSMTQLLSLMVVIALIALSVLLVGWFFRQAAAGPSYRRTKTYKTRDKHREFKVLGINNLEDLEDFITFLVRTFKVRILEEDRELDDMVWVIGTTKDWIEIHYDDHDGTRLRAPKKSKGGLFGQLEKALKA